MVNIQSVESFQVTSTLPKSNKLTRAEHSAHMSTRNPPPPLSLKRKGIDNKECKDKRKKEEVDVDITGSNKKSLSKKKDFIKISDDEDEEDDDDGEEEEEGEDEDYEGEGEEGEEDEEEGEGEDEEVETDEEITLSRKQLESITRTISVELEDYLVLENHKIQQKFCTINNQMIRNEDLLKQILQVVTLYCED